MAERGERKTCARALRRHAPPDRPTRGNRSPLYRPSPPHSTLFLTTVSVPEAILPVSFDYSTSVYKMADRLAQVAGHLSGSYPRGLLAGEVAIITGTSPCSSCFPGALASSGSLETYMRLWARTELTDQTLKPITRRCRSGMLRPASCTMTASLFPSLTVTAVGYWPELRVALREGGREGCCH